MAMGRESDRQGDLMVSWAEMPRSPGHVFYDRLQEVLLAGGFDLFVETVCQPYYAPKRGSPASVVLRGAVRIRCRCAIFCGWRTGRRFPIIRGCPRRAGGCLMKSTRRSLAGC